MESTNNKSRTPSRCREWERQRRNKFNDAITKLGELVREINKTNDSSGKDTENVQYPKIEIIQKAIICLTTFIQEKTQLKTEILALQVKLEAVKSKKIEVKDASTQVFRSVAKKNQISGNKFMKVVVVKKSKSDTLKEKQVSSTNAATLKKDSKKSVQTTEKQLPKLLPRSLLLNEKKKPENTIVVLPATPYIFPQRPLLFPTVPPAIVLLDPNLQNLSKPVSQIINRTNGDVTKTTMVNILPISAYSRPLSAIKNKKNSVKPKKNINKKTPKSPKSKLKDTNSVNKNDPVSNKTKDLDEHKSTTEPIPGNKMNKEDVQKETAIGEDNSNTKEVPDNMTVVKKCPVNLIKDSDKETLSSSKASIVPTSENNENTDKNKNIDSGNVKASIPTSVANKSVNIIETNEAVRNKFCKIPTEKIPISDDKDKENKLPNILDTTLCDTAVDGGNARLELAEEFLAASPTAAFLMSFPLVSGNRADSPADEPQNTVQVHHKDNNQRRHEVPTQYFEKPSANENRLKTKSLDLLTTKSQSSTTVPKPTNASQKYTESNLTTKQTESKITNAAITTTENPFLNLPMPSLISTSCTISDSSFGLDFDCNISKPIQSQSSNYASNNLFYKSDPFNSVKNTIYSTSNITSTHEFNNLGLYPCAMEKYTSKGKSDYTNVEENLMKIGSSRLTYDIDLGWSHKSFDFVNCTTTSSTLNKDILTTVSAPYSSSYNPFNPEFHVPLVSNSSKKDITTKSSASFADTISNFYSQPSNLWSEDMPFYSNNISKNTTTKPQNYLAPEGLPTNANSKQNDKHYEAKQTNGPGAGTEMKTPNLSVDQQVSGKYKKSPSKMHINWMTSEIRPIENNCNPVPAEIKETHKTSYSQITHQYKKQDHNESYFPISMHNFVPQPSQEEFHVWPSARPVGPTEITMEPPPIHLPTLVGDLALGPHDKKKNTDLTNRVIPQTQDIQNCGNFLSVTQLMNRSSDNMSSRYQASSSDTSKHHVSKQISSTYFPNETSRKTIPTRLDQLSQPCYGFNESKVINNYEGVNQFAHNKNKINTKPDKSSKSQKNNYSAESLIRGVGCTQKIQDNSNAKCVPQKYNEFNTPQDNTIAQVSHFPPIIDYADNSYASQQFSGTTLYNSTTNTISNSFYSNFMPGSSNLMSSNYTTGAFSGEYIDYNQADCNYTNHKYEELKMRNNSTVFPQDKVPSNYKSSRRETATKHKLECSKKDSNKKYQSKRAKLNTEVEEWGDSSHLLWQNKAPSKRHANLMSEELPFPNYVGNQMPAQYQPEFFNSHLMPSNVQSVGHNVDRSISFPATSRANFNLSTIFPEITMKVQ